MALEDRVEALRKQRGGKGPEVLQEVTKDRIKAVLGAIDLGGNADLIDAVFALLDDETPSWFANSPKGATISDGATTAHVACHVGILQRGGRKLDREGRDYWLKPLRQLGGIEAIQLNDGAFIAGHPTAKSPNNSYRLEEGLIAILRAPDGDWKKMLAEWASKDAARERQSFQAEMAEAAKALVDRSHADLIATSVEHYAARFLPGFQVLYIDDADGDRISQKERDAMAKAGVELTLEDAMPDALLWNPETDWLWVIEAVTSDGEVDLHKVNQMRKLADRSKKAGVGFTTTYLTWKDAAARQGKNQNIAPGTYIWIAGDPAKVLKVEG